MSARCYNPTEMKASVVNGEQRAGTHAADVNFQGLDRDQLLDVYRCMLRSRKIDDKEIQLRNQSRAFFRVTGRPRRFSSQPASR